MPRHAWVADPAATRIILCCLRRRPKTEPSQLDKEEPAKEGKHSFNQAAPIIAVLVHMVELHRKKRNLWSFKRKIGHLAYAL